MNGGMMGKGENRAKKGQDRRALGGMNEDARMPEPGSPLGMPWEDARWTAWALGEEDMLDPKDRVAMDDAVEADDGLAREIEATRSLAGALASALTQRMEAPRPGAALRSAQRRRLHAAARKTGPGRLRLRLSPGLPRWATAASALLLFVFLGIPTGRWAFDQPVLWSIRIWADAVSRPEAHLDSNARSALPTPPPPRPFIHYLLWRDDGGVAGPVDGPAAMGGARRSSGDRLSVLSPTAAVPEQPATSSPGRVDAELANPLRRIVLSGGMRVEVEDVMRSVEEVSDWTVRRGGFVESSRLDQSGTGGGATLTLRIPRLEFDALRRSVREMSLTVLSDQSDRVDRTAQHADLAQRLASLRTAEAELRELLAAQRESGRATEDILEIFDLLKEYRAEIEGLEGQLELLDEQAALSTLTLELVQHQPPTPSPTPTATPLPIGRLDRIGETAQTARSDMMDALEFVLRTALYLAIAILPPILLLLAFLWLWWQATHRIAAWWKQSRSA